MLSLCDVTVYQDNQALFPPVNLTVGAGERVTLMGPSGCGKSTLLSVIVGDLAPAFRSQGEVLLDGQSLEGVATERRHIGLLYQEDLLFPHMNVGENLAFALPRGVGAAERRRRIADHLALAGMPDAAERDVASLSGGQRARVSLLRTLLAEPRAVLLDEPFSKLDRTLRQQFRHWVFSTLHARQVPVLQVTHDVEDAAENQFYDLVAGRMVSLSDTGPVSTVGSADHPKMEHIKGATN